jgi:hypothetical protein
MRQTGGAVELRRQRELGDIISDSWALLKAQLGVYATVVAPSVLVAIAISLIAFAITDAPNNQLLIAAAFLPVQVLVYQLVSAAVVAVLKASEQGRTISAGEALDAAQDRARDVLSVSLRLMFAFVLIMTIIGAYWGVKKAIQWIFAIPLLIFEELRWDEALFHSERLVQGRWWATLGRLIASGLVLGLPTFFIGSFIAAAIPAPIGTILSSLPNLISTPFPIIATVLMYNDRKLRREQAPPQP